MPPARMSTPPRDVVTGAFSFTGSYVAERLLARGRGVTTLTNHPDRPAPFADAVRVEPYRFDDPDALAASLDGAEVLYNTFWIRDPRAGSPPGDAVRYSRRLVEAAEAAGVERVVHLSVSNADASSLPYYRQKAAVERLVERAAPAHAILRPTLVYGVEDLLVNNLAWALRRFPAFPLFGDGRFPVQPVFVGDVADAAVEQGGRREDVTLDVAGPEVLDFVDLVRRLREGLDARCRLVRTPPAVALLGVRALEVVLRDRLLTRDEVRGLRAGLLATDAPPRGTTRFGDWVDGHADALGTGYTSYRERYGTT